MKSLRLSLILYFLILVAAALGGVSYFGYQSTEEALRAQETSTRELRLAQYKDSCDGVERDFDRDLRNEAVAFAENAVYYFHQYQGLAILNLLSVNQFQSHLQIPGAALPAYLRVPNPFPNQNSFPINFTWPMRTSEIRIVVEQHDDMPPEQVEKRYFRVFYPWKGKGAGRIHDNEEPSFTLNDDIRRKVWEGTPHFDTVEIRPGRKVRRVTLKAKTPDRLPGQGVNIPPVRSGGFRDPKGPPKDKNRNFRHEFIMQYGVEMKELESDLALLMQNRDRDLAQHEEKTALALADLRSRMLWIGLSTFVALVLGGFSLVHFGLFPLNRLTEAVRKVSAKDFRLPIDASRLPSELKPIAGRLEETLEELKRAFAREKQASADISHELRTPLATLLTTIDVTLNKPRSPEYYQEILEECRASGQHMNTLVERLLTLARLDAGASPVRAGAVDVNSLAKQCADLVRPLARARSLDLNVYTNGPAILNADPEKLREVINNLLSNAIEYNKPNGAIDLTVGRENGHLMVEVRDTGIGIPPEAKPRIFERFFRADPSRHTDGVHAGLGLSIVKGYVDLMGGSVAVDSSDAGSTFRVQLPV